MNVKSERFCSINVYVIMGHVKNNKYNKGTLHYYLNKILVLQTLPISRYLLTFDTDFNSKLFKTKRQHF